MIFHIQLTFLHESLKIFNFLSNMEIIVQIFSSGLLLIKISLKNALCLFKIKLLTFNSTKNFSDLSSSFSKVVGLAVQL